MGSGYKAAKAKKKKKKKKLWTWYTYVPRYRNYPRETSGSKSEGEESGTGAGIGLTGLLALVGVIAIIGVIMAVSVDWDSSPVYDNFKIKTKQIQQRLSLGLNPKVVSIEIRPLSVNYTQKPLIEQTVRSLFDGDDISLDLYIDGQKPDNDRGSLIGVHGRMLDSHSSYTTGDMDTRGGESLKGDEMPVEKLSERLPIGHGQIPDNDIQHKSRNKVPLLGYRRPRRQPKSPGMGRGRRRRRKRRKKANRRSDTKPKPWAFERGMFVREFRFPARTRARWDVSDRDLYTGNKVRVTVLAAIQDPSDEDQYGVNDDKPYLCSWHVEWKLRVKSSESWQDETGTCDLRLDIMATTG